MPSVTFTFIDGSHRTIEATAGMSVMEAAITNGIDGIAAQCGGALCCATCHVYVDRSWLPRLPAVQGLESDMLCLVVAEQRSTSRLSCQIKITDALDGLVVAIPERQTAT
jgi:ferredoxin, 2Fe-2S